MNFIKSNKFLACESEISIPGTFVANFIKADLNSTKTTIVYNTYGIGYTIRGVHSDNEILVLAAGYDGVLIYSWNKESIKFIGKIDTSFANNVKIIDDLILVATRDGLEVIQIDLK